MDEARALVAEMTVDEKLGCLDGDVAFWPGMVELVSGGYNTRSWPGAHVDRLGVPGIDFIDGPRGCVVGPSTTFPVSMARGASFDPDLERRIGDAIGQELRVAGATYTGAVCMNLLRHPAWGRAQETYGEDPHHVGELAAALTEGLQRHVMACMKHYALNSMENARFSVDITVDDRALHEVYLPHFRRVADAGVASVMSAYNSVNGQWCGQHATLLIDILRTEWGWDGFVITDFINGFRDPVASVAAGCNIEMPFAQQRAHRLPDALQRGELDLADVDARVTETMATLLRFGHVFRDPPDPEVVACPEHRALAREAASASMVLLRNDDELLPLDPSQIGSVAVVGELADLANLGDAGSSNIRFTPDPVTPLAGLRVAFGADNVLYSETDPTIAATADVAVVVVGYTRDDEGEYIGAGMNAVTGQLAPPVDHPVLGFSDQEQQERFGSIFAESAGIGGGGAEIGGDRDSLRLSPEHESLIERTRAVCPDVIVAVVAGSAVVMPWLETVPAAVMTWYAGSEGGNALADVLVGTAEPGGRLPFAVPVDEADLVAFDKNATEFGYGLLHGQWHLDATTTPAHLPFGHGLGYTSFALDASAVTNGMATVSVTNVGRRSGATVVQVYAGVPGSAHLRAPRRLVGFQKVTAEPGTQQTVSIELDVAALDVRLDGRWVTEDLPIRYWVGFDAASAQPVPGDGS